MSLHSSALFLCLVFAALPPAHAQQPDAEAPMDHSSDHRAASPQSGDTMATDMTMPAGDTQSAPQQSTLRDPHEYAEGADFGPLGGPHMADSMNFGTLFVDRLEAVNTDDNSSSAYDLQAWYGKTFDRVTLKAEGSVDAGRLQESRTELMWTHALAAYWGAQLGLRYDTGVVPDRTWLAFGIQGLAPYWFEVEATGYLGDEGRSALRLMASYELLLTQKLIVEPRLETALYGKSDDASEVGSGLSTGIAGIRVRYEITRQFAPYVGVEWAGKFGRTRDIARADGAPTEETRWVAGLRMWF